MINLTQEQQDAYYNKAMELIAKLPSDHPAKLAAIDSKFSGWLQKQTELRDAK